MTRIIDAGGTRWVDIPKKRKQRKTPRAIRFADVKPGDQLVLPPKGEWYRQIPFYYAVTDRWFDPVAGQEDHIKGEMVGYAQIDQDGNISSHKNATTLRGLASQGFQYADQDFIGMCKARIESVETGDVVGIGFGRTIRARPKIPGL